MNLEDICPPNVAVMLAVVVVLAVVCNYFPKMIN